MKGIDKPASGVVSIYDYNYSDKVWKEFNRMFKNDKIKNDDQKKTIIFTMPPTPIKCAGAP